MVEIFALIVQSNSDADFNPSEVANAISEDDLKHITDTTERNNFMTTESFHIVAQARVKVLLGENDMTDKPISRELKALLNDVEARVKTCKPSVVGVSYKYSGDGGGYDLEPSKSLSDRDIDVTKARVSCAGAQLDTAYRIARENQARVESCTIKETWLMALMIAYALGIKDPGHTIHLHVPQMTAADQGGL